MSLLVFMSAILSASASDKERAVLEMTRTQDGLWSVDVLVNDGGPYRMIVDTAAAMSSLRRHVASSEGPSLEENKFRVHGLLSIDEAQASNVRLRLGALEHSGPALHLTDPKAISDPTVSGLIGWDLLLSESENYRYLVIDLGEGKLELGSQLSDFGLSRRMEWTRLSRMGREFGLLTFEARVERVRTTVLIDTGLKYAVINEQFADRLRKRGSRLKEKKIVDVVGEEKTLRAARLDWIEGANIRWGYSNALVHESPALNRISPKGEPVLLMGLQHLGSRILVIDMKRNRIALPATRNYQSIKACTGSRLNCAHDTKSYHVGNRNRSASLSED